MTEGTADLSEREGQRTKVLVLGLNYRRAPLTLRERLAFTGREVADSLRTIKDFVPEGVILSTCHRVEIYAAAPDAEAAAAKLKVFWSKQSRVLPPDFEPYLYQLTGRDAEEHLFVVACGLDSAIVGESQILGQVREALRMGLAHRSTGPVLSTLFQRAITAGKRARTETSIGRNAASIGSAAVDLARQTFGDLTSARVLLVGAGKMGELAARNLMDKGAAEIAVIGRSVERAQRLALQCGSHAALTGLEEGLRDCDIAITCTSAPHHVILAEMVERVLKARNGRPLLLIDIAVPRDVEPEAGEVKGVSLRNIDDLESVVTANVRSRLAESAKVAPIIRDELDGFERWLAARTVVPTIRALRRRAEAIRQSELARTSAVLSRLPEPDRRRIEALTLAMQKKLLHRAITLLRSRAAEGDGYATAQAIRHLFSLDTADGSPRVGNPHQMGESPTSSEGNARLTPAADWSCIEQ